MSTIHTAVIPAGVSLAASETALTIGMIGDDPAAAMWTGAVLAFVAAAVVLATQTGSRRMQQAEAVAVG